MGVILLLIACVGIYSERGSTQPAQGSVVDTILPTADVLPIASGAGGSGSISGDPGGSSPADLSPPQAGVFATPAPASVASGPAMRPHEVFGFAPYWTLADSADFDLADLTTVDYFAVGINPDGSLDNSGAGWQGYESQSFIDLIDRAHTAGDRVVITVNDFSQSSLDQLAASPTAPETLAQSLLFLVKARSLDGVNLDLEGQGSTDQAGITNLVKVVSQTLKAANPHYQVTMDTYASSAGDPTGFYDIAALTPYVDGFFVMAYQLNLRSPPASESDLTSSMFSNQTALRQYSNAVPTSKVLLGLPAFGYDWPTTDGTLNAQPAGGPTIITYGQEIASGHPMYWDPVTDTAWTSYQVGSQWHEAFFENPNSLYAAAQLAHDDGIAGVGLWALGMDSPNDQGMVSALAGNAPSQGDLSAGPSSTSTSPNPTELAPLVASPPPTSTSQPATNTTTSTSTTTTTTTTTTVAAAPAAAPQQVLYTYAGSWQGAQTRVLASGVPSGQGVIQGTMTNFHTADPNLQCLDNESALDVYQYQGDPTHDYVITRTSSGDCADAAFIFERPTPTTTQPAAPAGPVLYTYQGNWLGDQTRVLPTAVPKGKRILEGTMIDFTTADPNLKCLSSDSALDVYFFDNDPTHDYVIAHKWSGDCANAAFIFVPAISAATATSPTTVTGPTSSTTSTSG